MCALMHWLCNVAALEGIADLDHNVARIFQASLL